MVKHKPTWKIHSGKKGGFTVCGIDTKKNSEH